MSRLKRFRELRGCDAHQLAREANINSASYFDLEADRPDWADEISIRSLHLLARALNVAPSALLEGGEEIVATPESLAALVNAHLRSRGISSDDFSQEIGWDIGPLLRNPTDVANLNTAGLRAICEALGLDWLSVLDEMQVDRPVSRG